MRKSDLKKAIQNIQNAIIQSQIYQLVSILPGKEVEPELIATILESVTTYNLLSDQFTKTEYQILEIFDLKRIGSPLFWRDILSDNHESNRLVNYTVKSMQFAIEYLPKVVNILETSEIPLTDGQSTISITLPEKENHISSTTRVIDTLQAIENLYEVCATLNNLPPRGLSILNLESGSDKSFDLLGAAEVIRCVKEVIIDLWDRVVFFRERKAAERINLVIQSLPILDHIGKLEKEGSLGPEQAELMRRKIIEGATKFLGSGATIPEFEQASKFEPRILMQPEQKLLTSIAQPPSNADAKAIQTNDTTIKHEEQPKYTITNTEDTNDIDPSKLSESELATLRDLIRKAQNHPPNWNLDNTQPIE